ncbi:MAG: hypothetical protein NC120_06735 [Ruminococcus sp.]|nr:hypothetical protein [Ruminococcus sp.]
MTTILLIPVKLLAKAVLYLLAAVVGAVGFAALFVSAILQKIGFFCGGTAIAAAIIMWIMAEGSTALTVAIMGAAAVLLPVIATFISSGIVLIKEKLLDVSADIELI